MKAIELFAGIGGFRLACDEKGIHTVFANDIKESACVVYKDQFGESELKVGDINALMEKIPEHDLLTGGFPCQPFSSAGKKNGIRDPRGTLFQSIVHILESHRPKYFILENVKRLLSMENGEHFATILDELSSLGYSIEWRLLNAMHHGLPQNRQRLFITGTFNSHPQIRLLANEEIGDLTTGHRVLLKDAKSWQKITDHKKSFPEWGLAKEGRFLGKILSTFYEKKPPLYLREILQKEVSSEFDFTETTLSWIKKIRQLTNMCKVSK